jgi:hypothetical protein
MNASMMEPRIRSEVMKKWMTTIGLVMAIGVLAGCTEAVPPGYVGMIMEPIGLTGLPLQPGRHACYGRDRLILVETKEVATKEAMQILCKDSLNFKFDLVLRTRLKSKNGRALKEILNKQGSNINEEDILTIDTLYTTYVRPAARNVARGVVGQYETTQIQAQRAAIQAEITKRLTKELEGTPMELVAAYPSNFDYPDVITQAVERQKKREVEINEERARQATNLLKATNRQQIAEKMKVVRAKEAEAEAAYIAIVGKAITPEYLQRMRIQANQDLYGRVGAGDKVIVTGGEGTVIPVVGGK